MIVSLPAYAKNTKGEDCSRLLEIHGHIREDQYGWLRDRTSPQTMKYLLQQNLHSEEVMASQSQLIQTLTSEIARQINADYNTSSNTRLGPKITWTFDQRSSYPRLVLERKTLLDLNELADPKGYFHVGAAELSPDGRRLAYATDVRGRRLYTLRVRDLKSGKDLPTTISNITPQIVWAADGQTLFYVQQDPQTLRPYRLFRWHLDGGGPELVFEETDPEFSLRLKRSTRGGFLFLTSYKRGTSEVRYLSADQPTAEWHLFEPRQDGVEYFLEDGGDRFFVLTDHKNSGFQVMQAPVSPTVKARWTPVWNADSSTTIEGLNVHARFLVLTVRRGLGRQFVVLRRDNGQTRVLTNPLSTPAQLEILPSTSRYDAPGFTFMASSLSHPGTEYFYDADTDVLTPEKSNRVEGFDPRNYRTIQEWAIGKDGTRIPITLLMKKDLSFDGQTPVLLHGYGAYGDSQDIGFKPEVLSLVNRGFVFAIAHVRGGADMGRDWYNQGRLEHKHNSFDDFIAAAEHLVRSGLTSPRHLYADGYSAGGLLMATVANRRPDLFHGMIAGVPFVDVVTTMLDETLPLTTSEYHEWGDPRRREDYFRMLEYSPYDNVKRQIYPHLLVTGAFYDSQVPYWEPAKWVAKLGEFKTEDHHLLLRTLFAADHEGSSGRLGRARDLAIKYAFLLGLENGSL